MNTTPIEFVSELPKDGRSTKSQGRYAEFFNALRHRPMAWAKFPKQGSSSVRGSVAIHINHGRYVEIAPHEFEAVNRQGVLYVRYVGGDSK